MNWKYKSFAQIGTEPFRFIGALKDKDGMHAGYGPVGAVYEKISCNQCRGIGGGTLKSVLSPSHAEVEIINKGLPRATGLK